MLVMLVMLVGVFTVSTVAASAAENVAVMGIELDKTTATCDLALSNTWFEVNATIIPGDATNQDIFWMTSDDSIVEISDGETPTMCHYRGKKEGTATITAVTRNGKTASCVVTVVDSRELAFASETLSIDMKDGVHKMGLSNNLYIEDVDKCIWSVDNTSVATIDNQGKLTPIKAGEVNVTVKTADGGKQATCKVTVTDSRAITLEDMNFDLKDGSLKKVEYTANYGNSGFVWTVSDPSVATIDKYGQLTWLKKGVITVTATSADGAITNSCTVNVVDNRTITFNKTEATFDLLGGTEITWWAIKATKNFEGNVYWTVSDPTVLEISPSPSNVAEPSCSYHGLKEGTATITATTEDGKIVASCVVTVIDTVITELDILITPPIAGSAVKDVVIMDLTGKVDVQIHLWLGDTPLYPNSEAVFEAGKEYEVRLVITPKDGYRFMAFANGIEANAFDARSSVNGVSLEGKLAFDGYTPGVAWETTNMKYKFTAVAHTHDYTDGINGGNDTHHWKECKDVDCPDTAFKGRIEVTEHTAGTTVEKNATHHWYVCACGKEMNKAEHSGGTASCSAKAQCSVCNNEYGDFGGHTYGDTYVNDNPDSHYKVCIDPNCTADVWDTMIDIVAHSSKNIDCTTTEATCDVCGAKYPVTPADHTFGAWQDAVAPTCSAAGTVAHKECTVCHEWYDDEDTFIPEEYHTTPIEANNHKFTSWNSEIPATCVGAGTKAYMTCTLCEKNYESDGVTEIADLTIPTNDNHDMATEWTGVADGHYHACKRTGCEYHDTLAAHTPNADDGDCTTEITCSVCGETTTAASTHTDTNTDGKCDTCGKDMPTTPGGDEPGTDDPNAGNTEDPTDDNDGLPTGAIIAIVAGSVVVGVGGFALVWFVIKKKT